MEAGREDQEYPIPDAASVDAFGGCDVRRTKFAKTRLVPKEPSEPPPDGEGRLNQNLRLMSGIAQLERPRQKCLSSNLVPMALGWSNRMHDWVWRQTADPYEINPYSRDYIPSDNDLHEWMGNRWFDWTGRFGFRSF